VSGIDHYPLFVLSGIILNITPGADTVYILSRSVSQGRSAGVLSVLGISCGSVTHTILAAFGLSALLAGMPVVFGALKIAGAAYLGYLGIRMMFSSPDAPAETTAAEHSGYGKIFRQGYFTNLLNPKVALFFISFLPQFIHQGIAGGPVPFLILGATFIFTGTLWCLLLALGASAVSESLRRRRGMSKILNRLCGAVFVGLGIRILLIR
jgi:RhtB (resistance to homoserine/threonine) family protein